MHSSKPVHKVAPYVLEPTYFTRDGAFYRLRIWSEREWVLIPAESKPQAEYMPGLGWVGGDFLGVIN